MAIAPDRIPRSTEIHFDASVLLFGVGLALVVGLLIGSIPLVNLWGVDLASVLHEESRTGTTGVRARILRRALVVAQFGFAFVLLTGAGLLFASFRHLLTIDPGFKAEGVITASVVMPRTRYADDQQLRTFVNRTLDAIRGIPGVLSAGGTTIIPLGGNHSDSVILAEGYVMKPGESLISPMRVSVTPGYFEAMGTRLIHGRYFDQHDDATAPGVVIIDERLARRFWADANPIGRRMYRPSNPNDLLKIDQQTRWLTVVGVVHEVLLDDLTGNRTIGAYYFPYAQDVSRFFTLAIKTLTDSAAVTKNVRGEIAKVDPQLAVFDIRAMSDLTGLSLASRRAAMLLALGFGGVALFLSVIGIYGVLAYLVTQRRREIGIRLALGSSKGGIFTLVLREGTMLVISGLFLGIGGAVALRSAIESQVYGIRPMDPWVIGTITLGLTATALVACALPARRATQIDPVRVLSAY
jgi:predicted permease